MTPGGNRSSVISAKSNADSEVASAGFRITALPVASAGPSFQAHSEIGEFHGRIAATTPTGSCRV